MTNTGNLDSFSTELLKINTLEELEVFKKKVEKEIDMRNLKYPKFICECGSTLNKKGKGDHYKSYKHRKYEEKLELEKKIIESVKRVIPQVDKITIAPDMFN